MSEIIQIPGGTFCPATHVYRDENGVVIPSVTQIGESLGFTDLDNVPGDTLEHKRQLGDAVHYATHVIDTGHDLDWSTVHQDTGLYIAAWETCKEDLGIEILDSEVSGIHTLNGMKFSFTRDRVVKLRSFTWRFVLELKCAYKEEPFWKYQLGFYDIATPRVDKGEYLGRIAVQLKPDGKYKPYLYENPRDKDRCAYLLAAMHIKIDEGLWKLTSKRTENRNVDTGSETTATSTEGNGSGVAESRSGAVGAGEEASRQREEVSVKGCAPEDRGSAEAAMGKGQKGKG